MILTSLQNRYSSRNSPTIGDIRRERSPEHETDELNPPKPQSKQKKAKNMISGGLSLLSAIAGGIGIWIHFLQGAVLCNVYH